uniref:Uncharacterized protein n=1 Tax=Brassica campestris TaxID=3711 RepID=A0A3P6BFC8_BRACM|nr:unnamed protein product [Brassica rapa]
MDCLMTSHLKATNPKSARRCLLHPLREWNSTPTTTPTVTTTPTRGTSVSPSGSNPRGQSVTARRNAAPSCAATAKASRRLKNQTAQGGKRHEPVVRP